ncbi:choline transport protein [Punctularia strigosozonata HHB-11173 SS5]|uniref:Choline transport protein n=1 Tax=Punctularia strigosozonata (strain HHB-11173) TaxID=741275 RepID=R7S012_PUNST|nr:choline transport protein [Punctularia strigosozonata HHB-11173 SS5]EIN03573.1 choline transport protein [Punctularia strigosozonata HHB-11173 SS5]
MSGHDLEKNGYANGVQVSDGLAASDKPEGASTTVEAVNASGHVDKLTRHYGLLSICATALTVDSAWIALGGSLVVASANGGPPGIIYEFLAACFYYSFIAASIAELASSIPSSGGVYHWASVTPGPRFGRALGFFCGSMNFFGWVFDLASIVTIPSNIAVQMYAVFHPDYVVESWHVYIAFLIINWGCCFFVIFCNHLMPTVQNLGLFLVVGGGIITIIVVVAMQPHHASSSFVWTEWTNTTGWSNGVAFLTGMLNGAFTIGTPDAVTHMAEEMPNPRRDLPKAVAAQIILGTLTGFFFVVAIMYGITDFDAVLTSNGSFPLAEVYAQATGSKGATFGLLLIILLAILVCTIGTFVTVGRILWTLARDNVTPFPSILGNASTRWSCPIESTLLVGDILFWLAILSTGFGAIQLGSKTAFTDLVGSFIILTTTSYGLAIVPHLLSGRSNVPIGPFWMGKWGYLVNGFAVLFIILTDIFYCFPYALPVDVPTMNYNSVILAGIVFITTVWWFIHGARKYQGPHLPHLDEVGHEVKALI